MKYTMKEILASLTTEKKAADGIWSTWVLRPLSMPVTWLALRLGLRANTISYLSALVVAAGGVLYGFPGFWLPFWGAVIMNVFGILDCVDGNVARVTKTCSPWGGWADAVTGFIAYTAMFLSTGVYLYMRTGWWPFLLITAFTSSANLLTRVAYQIYKNIEPGEAHEAVSFERMLAENVGITGFMTPALIVFHFTGGLQWLVWFNLVFYSGGLLATLYKLAGKARKAA